VAGKDESGTGTAVEVVDPATGEVTPAAQSGLAFADVIDDRAVEAYLADMNTSTDEAPESVQLEIARRILQADSPDAVFAATQTKSARDLLNQPLEVTNVRWVKSAHEGGAPKFAVVDATMVFGDAPVTFTCGALNVVLTLYKLQKLNALPAKVTMSEKASGSVAGRSVITIAPYVQ
jgi:hypothetical protein